MYSIVKNLFSCIRPGFSPSQWLRVFCLAILFGLLLERFFAFNYALHATLFSGALFYLFRCPAFALFGCGFLSFFWASFITDDDRIFSHFSPEFSQEYRITATVNARPENREKNQRVYLRLRSVDGEAVSERVLATFPKDFLLWQNDTIEFSGYFSKPRSFGNFDYRTYLKNRGVRFIITKTSNPVLLKSKNFSLFSMAHHWRAFLSEKLENSLPSPHRFIAMGVLLGVKSELPRHTDEDFRRSGLSHVLVVSGYNVSIVTALVMLLFRPLGPRIAFGFTIIALILFVLLVGIEPPVVRASFFGAVVGWGVMLGMSRDIRNVAIFSAVIMAIVSPQTFQSDMSFWLSFSATMGIILLVPLAEKYTQKIPLLLGIKPILLVTTCAQLAVTPFLILSFGVISMVSVLANLLSEPIIPLIMLLSVLAIFAGFFSGIIASLLALPAFLLIETLLWIANIFGRFDPLEISDFFGYILLATWGFFFLWAMTKRDWAIMNVSNRNIKIK